MGGKSRIGFVKSPKAMEKGIKSIPSVTWNPFSVFPKEIYLEIFDKLDSPNDKHNFMNAHMKWYALFKSRRTHFLFQQVFKELIKKDGEDYSEQTNEDERDHGMFANYKHCRLVSHDWDDGIQSFFQLHESYTHFNLALNDCIWTPQDCNYKDLDKPCKTFMWAETVELEEDIKLFSLTHPPSKNPFFSRSIALDPYQASEFRGDWEDLNSYMAAIDNLLEIYGRHFWHCRIQLFGCTTSDICLRMAKWLSLMSELKTLELKVEFDDDVEIDVSPMQPELNKLVYLKSTCLPPPFKSLLGKLKFMQEIPISYLAWEEREVFKNIQFRIDQGNLKEAFLTLNGVTLENFDIMQRSKPFQGLKKLVFISGSTGKYCPEECEWPEWKMIFRIIEEKFPELEDLSISLPYAPCLECKWKARDQSLECQLNLPKLKSLSVLLPNLSSLDFILPCKALEKIKVFVNHSEWELKRSWDLGKREIVNFNMRLNSMWESNVWTVFPKLRQVNIFALQLSGWARIPWNISIRKMQILNGLIQKNHL